jgi:hypothetical protein
MIFGLESVKLKKKKNSVKKKQKYCTLVDKLVPYRGMDWQLFNFLLLFLVLDLNSGSQAW